MTDTIKTIQALVDALAFYEYFNVAVAERDPLAASPALAAGRALIAELKRAPVDDQQRCEQENAAFREWWDREQIGKVDAELFTLTVKNACHAAWQERASREAPAEGQAVGASDEGPIYRHKRTDGLYTILYAGLAKLGDGEWVSSIFYRQHGTGNVFARDAAAFATNFDLVAAPAAAPVQPIPMILHCPACHLQHIDAPDERTPDWLNLPHRSHLCHGCGHIWRPADVATEGVAAIQTKGKADSPAPAQEPPAVERLQALPIIGTLHSIGGPGSGQFNYVPQEPPAAVEAALLQCDIQPRPLSYSLSDFHRAIYDGPLNYTWQDKPHRLVYDLIAAVRYYAAPPAAPTQPAPPDLHAAIMALPMPEGWDRDTTPGLTASEIAAYRQGHRDARHAAAELVRGIAAPQPLTKAQIGEATDTIYRSDYPDGNDYDIAIARAVEAKFREVNGIGAPTAPETKP